MDAYSQSVNHRLASTIDLKIMDFFLSESISSEVPVKLLYEWVNDKEHPRDADDGMLMMKVSFFLNAALASFLCKKSFLVLPKVLPKCFYIHSQMVSFHPICSVSSDGRLKSDESRVTLQILPLRCHLDQLVLRVIQEFFSSGLGGCDSTASREVTDSSPDENCINNVEAFFETFHVKPCKLKVNYRPIGIDAAALREGSYVELLNLFSLENVELTLKSVEMKGLYGWGSVFSDMFRRCVEDICNTQLHKFLAGAAPLNPISNLGGGVADLVLIPMLHYKKDRNLSKGIRKATTHFASTVTLEALNTTSKLTRSVARTLSKATSPQKRTLSLPARPDKVPRSIGDTAQHAYDSISRGLKASNYMIVVVPRQEYKKSGATGAVKSVVRGIPIAILAPISGASEALSYTLVGIRNQLHPSIRKEEEVRQSGLRR
jgi:autophagy-related protein 2